MNSEMHPTPNSLHSQCEDTRSIHRVPTEILTEIFSLCCIPEEDFDIATRDTNLISPAGRTALRLSLVCSRWRSVALGAPRLWSIIIVSVYSRPIAIASRTSEQYPSEISRRVRTHPIGEIVKLYVERSQDCPLIVMVSCGWSSPLFLCDMSSTQTQALCGDLLKPVLQILCGVSQRWRAAQINLPSSSMISHIPQCRPGKLIYPEFTEDGDGDKVELEVPLLEVLDIFPGPCGLSFPSIPRLHTLSVKAWSQLCQFPLDETLFSAPALHSLTLRNCTVRDLRTALSPLEGIGPGISLHFEDFTDLMFPRVFETHNNIYELHRLKVLSFHIDHSTSRALATLCGMLKADNVEKMEFTLRPLANEKLEGEAFEWLYTSHFPYGSVIDMIRRSDMPLKVLKIDGFLFGSDADALVEVLRLLPSVEVLCLGEGRVGCPRPQIINVGLGDEDKDLEVGEEVRAVPEVLQCASRAAGVAISTLIPRLIVSSAYFGPTPLLPRLADLSLIFRPNCEARDLLNIVYSRWRAQGSTSASTSSKLRVTSLKSLSVSLIIEDKTRIRFMKEYRNGLKELKDAGFDVQYNVMNYR